MADLGLRAAAPARADRASDCMGFPTVPSANTTSPGAAQRAGASCKESEGPPKDVRVRLRKSAFENGGAACRYVRIFQSFLEEGDDVGADYAFAMAEAYFEACQRDFWPLRQIVHARRSTSGEGE